MSEERKKKKEPLQIERSGTGVGVPPSKAELFLDMLDKSVKEYNEKQIEMQVEYSAAFSNSSEDKTYDVRTLIRHTFGKMD